MSQTETDNLSPVARQILNINRTNAYSLLTPKGDGNTEAQALLTGLKPGAVFHSALTKSFEDQKAALTGLWLWHDWLEVSHEISQSIETPTGSFWHAIMHRRGGDFSNCKHWYARCADHPVIASLASQASAIVNPLPADRALFKIIASGWNPNAYVDLVEAVHDKPEDFRHRVAVALQQLEWRTLFEFCTR